MRSIFNTLMLALLLLGCSKEKPSDLAKTPKPKVIESKTVLFLNSYHKGYEWSDGIEEGVTSVLKEHNHISIVFHRMDTKRNGGQAFITDAASKAKALIDSIKPDLVITSDDNAAKYVIVPYFIESALPVVFTGVNWSAAEYGFPCSNVTGMIEVQLIDQIITTLKKHAKGDRVAFLKGKDASAIKEAAFFEKRFDLTLDKRFVSSFEEWLEEFEKLQKEADMILLGNAASIPDWDSKRALALVEEKSSVPTGNWDAWMAPYCLVTFATNPLEQGEWAGTTALRILQGTNPSDISIVQNRKARVYLNMKIASKMGIKFSSDLIENANLFGLE